jgi:HSP20 family molecular chaperone IbpA
MADAINRKPNSQSYLRQIQQEKAKYKRELMQAQKEDMKAVRDYYSDQTKQLEAEAAAAVLDIKQEARQMAEADRIAKQEYQAQLAESKKLERESRLPANSYEKTAVENSVEKKKLYSDRPQRAPLIQNYRSQETDNFYRVQDRGSRISEGPGYYTIEAYAPEHEKDNLRVSIQRNKAVISGQRKFTDSADGGDKEIKNNNYQSFREEFKFDRPVSGEGMKRERIGDFVRFTIPKLEAVGGWDEDT